MEKRNSKLEIVRIISIALIVLSHYVVHSGYNIHELPVGFNRFILEFGILGNIGTMLFVLITGYFLINSRGIKLRKIFHFIIQVSFYSIIIYILLVIFNKEAFNVKSIIMNMFPISFKRYWFATAYFILYLFHPFINKFINALERNEHFYFIILGVFIFFVMSTFTTMDFFGNELIYFILLYSIGAYFSRYQNNYFYKNKNNLIMMIISIMTIASSIIVFDILGQKMIFLGYHSTYLLNMNSVFALLLAVSIFSIFSKMSPSSSRLINYVSALVFGVYLISDNKYLRSIIWCGLLKNSSYFSSNYLVAHMLMSIILVGLICLVIESIRKVIFDKLIFKFLDVKIDKLEKYIKTKRSEV